jgi:hypothetical protein
MLSPFNGVVPRTTLDYHKEIMNTNAVRISFKVSPTSLLATTLPSLCLLALFYSLAVHMRLSLGAWPASIGNNGFSQFLNWHAKFTWDFVSYFYAANIFLLPPAILVCLLKTPWRRYAGYLALHGVLCIAAYGLILLAPGRFLSWWWD